MYPLQRISIITTVVWKWLFLAGLLLPPVAVADEVSCPVSVNVKQEITQMPEGWEVAYEDSEVDRALQRITFFDGPPSQQASLKFNHYVEGQTEAQAVWNFSEDMQSRGVWLSCAYSRTTVILSKQIPSQISSCTVIYSTTAMLDGAPVIKKIQCNNSQNIE